MCGLVGLFGKLDYKDEDAIKTMMLLNWKRGGHSTGFAGIRNSGEVKIAKTLGGPWDLWEFPRFKEALNGHMSCAFIGHGRHATRGNITTVNAHPFHFGHIVGAHNGTLDHSCVTELEDLLGEKYPVDSMALIAAIAELGIKDAIPLLRGSWAISYVDLKEGSFNLIRNGDRPLWYATTKENNAVFYASEWPMIAAGVAKDGLQNNGEYRELARDKDNSRFFATAKDYLYSWDIAALQKGKSKPVCTKLEGKESFLSRSSNVGVHRGDNKSDPFRRETSRGTTTTSRTSSGDNNPLRKLVMDLQGTEACPYPGFSQKEFEEWTKDGCQFCHKPIPYGTKGITIYERQQMVLCAEHSSRVPDDRVRIYVKDLQQIDNRIKQAA